MFKTENDFVHWLQALSASRERRHTRHVRRERGVKLGIGDDAALVDVANGYELILTTDMSIEDVHFTCELHPARAVGHRALTRSLSDVAAMGGCCHEASYAHASVALGDASCLQPRE